MLYEMLHLNTYIEDRMFSNSDQMAEWMHKQLTSIKEKPIQPKGTYINFFKEALTAMLAYEEEDRISFP